MQSANDAREGMERGQTGDTTGAASGPADGPKRKRRRGRRILAIFVFLVVLLVILVALAPSLASTAPGRNLILSKTNKRLQGNIALADISLSWFGQCGARDLKVTDPQGREVLRVDNVNFAGGVWHARGAMKRLERVTVESPQVILYVNEKGEISLAQAFTPRVPSVEEKESGPVSIPEGGIIVRDGSVRVIRADGREYEAADIDVEVDLKAAGQVETKLQMALAGGGKLKGEVQVTQLLSNGKFEPSDANGKFRIYSEEGINVGPIADFALDEMGTVGQVALDIKGTVEAGMLAAEFATNLVGVGSPGAAGRPVEPTNLRLTGNLRASKHEVNSRFNLEGDAGKAQAEVAYSISDQPVDVSAERLQAVLFEGGSIELPQLSVTAQADLDLPALGKALPGLLHVRPDTEITGGKLEVTNLEVNGGSEPSAMATVQLTGLTAKTSEGEVRCEPIAVDLDVTAQAGQGLAARRAQLKSGFGHVTVSGTAAKLNGTVAGDLEALQRQIGQVFDFGSVELAGDLFAEIEVTRTQEDDFGFKMQMAAEGLRYKEGEDELALQLATLNNQGVLSLTDRKRPRVEITEAALNLDDRVRAETSGWYDFDAGTFYAEAELKQADLDFVGRQAAALGVDGLGGYSGMLQLQGRIDRTLEDEAIASEGTLQASNVKVDGEALTDQFRLGWSGVRFSPAGQSLNVQLAQLESAIAGLTVQEVNARFGTEMAIDGRVEGNADLARCTSLAARLAGSEDLPAVSGQLAFKTACRSDAVGFTATGDGSIRDFIVGAEAASPKEQLQFSYDATLNHRDKTISLRKVDLESGLLSTQVSGDIEQYDTLCSLALNGRYQIAWQRATEVLHEFAPATAETIALAGKSSGKLQARGPLRRPEARPAFRDLGAGLDMGWNSAEVYGVPLGEAAMSPSLANGVLKIPQTAISVAGGSVRLGGSVDFKPETPTLRIPGKLTVLQNIRITPQLGKQLLGRINPVFSQATRVEGTAGLAVQNLNLPLGKAMNKGGSGTGRLSLKDTRMQPGGLLGTLAELGGMGADELYTVRFSGLDLTVRDGRIHYKDFTMTFADNAFDLVFYGSVGFDDTLDLVVSIPVRAPLLKRLGVKGLETGLGKKLARTRIDVPLVGTREKPRLDFSKVDTKKLMRDLIKEGILGKDGAPDLKDLTDPKSLLEKSGLLDKEKSKGKPKPKGKKPKQGKSKKGKKKNDKSKDGAGGLDDLLEKIRGKSKEGKKSGDGD
jgi:hypothetical protein